MEAGRSILAVAARSAAVCLGAFALLNCFISLLHPNINPNLWWIDLRWMPYALAQGLLIVAGLCWVVVGWGNTGPTAWRAAAGTMTGLFILFSAVNIGQYYSLLDRGVIRSRFPVPVSLLILLTLLLILCTMPRFHARQRWAIVLLAPLWIAFFCLAQMLSFGTTDYRRPADAIIVLGASVKVDGTPSLALSDRVQTACELYQQHLAPTIILSGGPGSGPVHETQAMRRICLEAGVPDSALRIDAAGLNTAETVRHTLPILHELHARRVLVVSHAYHLPRVKLAYQQAGLNVYTVPAHETRTLARLPYFMLREIAGLTVYYLRSTVTSPPAAS